MQLEEVRAKFSIWNKSSITVYFSSFFLKFKGLILVYSIIFSSRWLRKNYANNLDELI